MKNSILTLLIFLGVLASSAQQGLPVVTDAIIDENGDTLAIITLPEFVKFSPPEFKNAYQEWRFNRLVRNVKKAYPYARLAAIRLAEYEAKLEAIETEYERRQFMRKTEDAIRDEFEEDLKQLTFTQGWIVLKLIDRETGYSSYDLVSEFRGRFRAFFWQAFAGIFGFDLKIKYDPEDRDKDIELIVRMIESGAI